MWNSRATHMHHTNDYFKEYNLIIKYGLPLKLELTGSADACPPKITKLCVYFNKSRNKLLTLNMYISILAMCWFQQTMSTKHSTFITTPSIMHDQDLVNMYIGTNVLMYERWLVLKVRYTAGRPASRPNAFAIP